MPADHIIADKKAFYRAVEEGVTQALQGSLVTFGIVPNKPETGYGWSEVSPPARSWAVCSGFLLS